MEIYPNKIPHQRKPQIPVEDHFVMVDISPQETSLRKFAHDRDVLWGIQCGLRKAQTMYACQVRMISNFDLQRLHVSSKARIGCSVGADRGSTLFNKVTAGRTCFHGFWLGALTFYTGFCWVHGLWDEVLLGARADDTGIYSAVAGCSCNTGFRSAHGVPKKRFAHGTLAQRRYFWQGFYSAQVCLTRTFLKEVWETLVTPHMNIFGWQANGFPAISLFVCLHLKSAGPKDAITPSNGVSCQLVNCYISHSWKRSFLRQLLLTCEIENAC